MTKEKNKGEALTNSALTASTGALATGGTALMALSMTTDAQAAIVYGTNFELNANSVSPAVLTNSYNQDVFVAFDGQVSWSMNSGFSHQMGTGKLVGSGFEDFSMLASVYPIGPAASFHNNNYWIGLSGQSGYIGVEFTVGAGTHYGWMEASVDGAGQFSISSRQLTISSWAYEDVPGVSIPAGAIPEPGSLSLLALGAAGLIMRRRRTRQ